MSTLESRFDEFSRQAAGLGNISASNDPLLQQSDANEQLLKGAEAIAAGRTLGLSDDEALSLLSRKRKRELMREGSELFRDDVILQDIDAKEREFQREIPQRAADAGALIAYGQDEADLQQVSSGRIGDIKQVDQAGGGEGGRLRRRLEQQIRDQLPLDIKVTMPAVGGDFQVTGQVDVGMPVPEDLKEAAILQELGLRFPERKKPKGKYDRKTKTRTFKRVSNASEESRPAIAGSGADISAYEQLMTAVNTGQVRLTDEIAPGKTVDDLLKGIEERISGSAARKKDRSEAFATRVADQKTKRENAARQLRQIAIQAAAEGDPLSREEAMALSARLLQPESVSRIKAEQEAIGNIASQGSTREILGETQMSDEAWKAKSTKQLSPIPIRSGDDVISSDQVYQMVDPDGNVVGYATDRGFVGNVELEGIAAGMPEPTPSQKGLVEFITQFNEPDPKGGTRPIVIGDATRAFTDRVAKLSQKRFGKGVDLVPTGIQSLGEAEKVIERLIDRGIESGTSFSRYNPADPSSPLSVPAGERPTASDLMSTIRMEPSEARNLASALYQLGLAEGSDVNQAGKQLYASRQGSYQPIYRPEGLSGTVNLELQRAGTPAVDLPRQNVLFDSPAGFFYDGVEPAFISNQQRARIGAGGANVNIQPMLRGLSDPDARAPFIGAVRGEDPVPIAGDPNNPNYRYRKGFGQDVSLEKGYSDLERSMVKGKRKYSQARVDKNVEVAKEVERRQAAGEEDAAVKRIMSQADSALFDEAMARQELESERNIRRQLSGGNPLNTSMESLQPVTTTSVPPSIAPDPWASTGSQSTPQFDAGGSQLPPDLKAQLDRLSQPKYRWAGYMAAPDTVSQTFRPGPYRRAAKIGAAGAGTMAVLAGMLGIGRDQEDLAQ
mgnify:CR=1 FL=1